MLTSDRPHDASRHDFYHVVHKGLRLGHCRMLATLGSHDFTDRPATVALLAKLRLLIELGRGHLEAENREIHSAIEARAPGASDHAAEDHDEHEQWFAELATLITAVEEAETKARTEAGRTLYKRFALFAAHDLAHMHEEETELLATLQGAFADDELMAIEGRIVAAIPPAKMANYLKLMVPAINPQERAGFVAKLKAGLPLAVFAEILSGPVKHSLTTREFAWLCEDLGLREAA